ncbi:TetR/AcrR family transcriptional regulator [Aestuariibius insulae]|uniref:TetR/AcrR family transcriptional regulator n=1 Tax=Aestuariibius insulae TaxID=2058287 RepID=UPI00345EFC2A
MTTTLSTRDRLIIHAAQLFQQRGYHGVGLTEILETAGVPKGSLYHHFPNGKADLAVAAADWASVDLLRIVDDAFGEAVDFRHGATTLCFKLAKLFDLSGHWLGCPISSTLFEGPANDLFRTEAARIFDVWIEAVKAHGVRLGLPPAKAATSSEALWIGLQGAWTLSRARRDSSPLRHVPDFVFGSDPQ